MKKQRYGDKFGDRPNRTHWKPVTKECQIGDKQAEVIERQSHPIESINALHMAKRTSICFITRIRGLLFRFSAD